VHGIKQKDTTMKQFYSLLTLLLLASFFQTSRAQTAGMLSGKVIDEKHQPIGFVNVAVLRAADAAVVTGAIADVEGNFLIKSPGKGRYFLKLSGLLGYTPLQTVPFDVTGDGLGKNFGSLQLSPNVKTLREVTVQAMRPTVVNHADKMVVSVEGTALAAGSTALEVLEKSPGVWIDQDGNIMLNGKTGVQIMLNGKTTYLSGKDLQNLLQGMSAENIKSLEIITNPSAKYDAAGTSGILNINLKRNEEVGMNGSLYAGYQYNKLSTYTSGADVNYKNGQWNTSAGVDLARRLRYRDMRMDRVIEAEGVKSKLDQDGYEAAERLTPALRLATDYDISAKHSLGAMTTISRNTFDGTFDTDTHKQEADPLDNQFIQAKNKIKSITSNGTLNLHYLGKLDTLGTTLTADLDYARIGEENDSEFFNKYTYLNSDATPVSRLMTTDNPTQYDIYSAKVDFTKTLGKTGKLELGTKASHVVSDNELRFYQVADGKALLDQKKSSHFIYEENLYAAYVNYAAELSKKWSLQAGLRAEQTLATGKSITLGKTNKRDYLDLFPSLFLQQKVSDSYQLSYKYSRRIERPYYENLNPFIFYLDPYTAAQGNPYLRPEYTHSFELTQTLKGTYNLVLGYTLTKDYIGEVPEQPPGDSITVFKQQNIDDFKSMSATLVAPVRLSGKWSMNNTATLAHMSYTSKSNGTPIDNAQVFFTAQSNQNIQLPQGLRLEVNAAYQGPGVYGSFAFKGSWWVDAGLKRSFMNDQLALTLNATDIFRSRKLIINTNLNGNANAIYQYHGAQGLRLTLRYRFNKGKAFEARKRNVNLDELNRTGGN